VDWDALMARQFRRIAQWRRYVEPVLEAVRREAPRGTRVYLVGSVAEGTFTAESDVDLLVVVPGEWGSRELRGLRRRLLERAWELGLPWDYPVDLIVLDEPRAEVFLRSAGRRLRLL